MKIEKIKLQKLIEVYNDRLPSRLEISNLLNVTDSTARIYRGILDNMDFLQLSDNTSDRVMSPNNDIKIPNILIFDIETAPISGYVWSLWKQSLYHEQVISNWFMITWSAKWLFDDKCYSGKLTPTEIANEDDKRITEDLWHLIDNADIIIAHNLLKFDLKKINTRFLVNGLQPPSPFQTVDTLQVLKKQFGFSSNRMDYVNDLLGIQRKIDTGGMKLWVDCMNGDQEALDKMEEYNINDVVILEELYLKLRPWIKSHPNIGVYVDHDTEICPTCGSNNIQWTNKHYHTTANKYSTFRCNNCNAVGRARTSALSKFDKEVLLLPTAR